MTYYQKLGAIIKQYREGQGLTVAQLAETANVSPSRISEIEKATNGKAKPLTYYKIITALGIAQEDLDLIEVKQVKQPKPEKMVTISENELRDLLIAATEQGAIQAITLVQQEAVKNLDNWKIEATKIALQEVQLKANELLEKEPVGV